MLPKEEEFFKEVTLRISSSLDVEIALWNCFDYLKDFIPVDEMNYHIYDLDKKIIGTIATATREGGKFHSPPRSVKLSEEASAELSQVVRPEIKRINRAVLDPVTRDMGRAHGRLQSSLLVMRLVIGGKRVGALTVRADGNDRYTDEDVRLMAALNQPFGIALSNSLRYREVLTLKEMLSDDNRYLLQELRQISGEEIIGSDFGLRQVMELVRQVAPLSSPVLLLGETGVGKEILASAIHRLSLRNGGPFIKINCGAIPESLLDSELFGHEKGAFTGALSRKRGRFERAEQGTLFLDEVGELPPNAQVRLLRVLQEKELERVGGTEPVKVDVRIIAATNRDLRQMTESGGFRADLWFRLNVFPILVPPLRERREDIPELVHHFIERKTRELGIKARPSLSPQAVESLMAYNWPGNVRELQNIVERSLILSRGDELKFEIEPIPHKPLPLEGKENEVVEGSERPPVLEELVARHIRQVLKITGGKVEGDEGAAQLLGLNPSTLRNKMRKLKIPYGRGKRSKR